MEDKTKQKIQELVPEIMELKFGCEFMVFDNKRIIVTIENEDVRNLSGDVVFTNSIEKIKTSPNSVILGRPITLADVLLAMEKVGKYILVDITGNLFTHDMSDGALVDEGIWDLTKNYDDQEQSVKDFIGQILGVK